MALLADHVHRITVEDYLQLVALNDDGRWDRTELIEGVIYDTSPESALHANAVMYLLDRLRVALPESRVMNAGSIEVGPSSLWDPDVYVLRPGTDEKRSYPLASDVELAVEVAITTRQEAMGPKYRGYAAAGIPDYWILDPRPGGYLLRHRDPEGARYQRVERIELPTGYEALDVAALLP